MKTVRFDYENDFRFGFRLLLVTPILFIEPPYLLVNNREERESSET